jgi:diguanylate cyclase (GGDEF)-like protein
VKRRKNVEKHQQARKQFNQVIDQAINKANRNGSSLALIFADIDQFRQINETYGHDAGDRVLAEMLQVLQRQIREANPLARWGGEEYIVLAPETALPDAQAVAERIRKAVEEHAFPSVGQVTISLGIAAYRAGDTSTDLIGRAEGAVHRAKEKGRNRVELE